MMKKQDSDRVNFYASAITHAIGWYGLVVSAVLLLLMMIGSILFPQLDSREIMGLLFLSLLGFGILTIVSGFIKMSYMEAENND